MPIELSPALPRLPRQHRLWRSASVRPLVTILHGPFNGFSDQIVLSEVGPKNLVREQSLDSMFRWRIQSVGGWVEAYDSLEHRVPQDSSRNQVVS